MHNISINCHSSICINGNVYIDPFNIKDGIHNADVVFVTHDHFDHYDYESIINIINEDSVIVTIPSVKEDLVKKGIKNSIVSVVPGDKGYVNGVEYVTLPSYNVGHHHFRELNYVAYLLTIDNVRYLICGDSDNTAELNNVRCDVLLVPIGGTYTMNAKEAAALTNNIKPSLVIPTHYNFIDGTGDKNNEKEFINYLDDNIEYKILIK